MAGHRFGALVALLAIAFTFVIGGGPALAATIYFQGFEDDISGWDAFGGAFNPTRVPSGTNGVTSAGGDWHAEGGRSATNWGGYSSQFPVDGYTTSIDIYLNVDGDYANDTRFDFSSAINNPNGDHRRDLIFNGGFYDDTDVTGSEDRFVFSVSYGSGRGDSSPKNPDRDPFAITSTGWYTFSHTFYDSGAGVLAVDFSISDAGGTVLHAWTLSDATDVIGVTVGGNRYGWFVNNEFPFLAFDNTMLTTGPDDPPSYLNACLYAGSLSQVGSTDPSCGRGTPILLEEGDDLWACLYAGRLSQVGHSEPSSCGRGSVVGLMTGDDFHACLYAGSISRVGTSEPLSCGRGQPVHLAGGSHTL